MCKNTCLEEVTAAVSKIRQLRLLISQCYYEQTCIMEETIYVLHEHSLSKDVGNLLTEHCTTTTKNIVLEKCKNSAILANI